MSSRCRRMGHSFWMEVGEDGPTQPLSLEEPLQKPYANHDDTYIGTRTLIQWLWSGTLHPKTLRTHVLRFFGPKTIIYEAFGLF